MAHFRQQRTNGVACGPGTRGDPRGTGIGTLHTMARLNTESKLRMCYMSSKQCRHGLPDGGGSVE